MPIWKLIMRQVEKKWASDERDGSLILHLWPVKGEENHEG